MHPLLTDPWIAARVEAAVAPYVGTVSEERLAWMREQLAETLASDPAAKRALREARRVPKDASSELPIDGEATSALEGRVNGRAGKGA